MILNIMIHTCSYVFIRTRIRSDESYRPKGTPRGISVGKGRKENATRGSMIRNTCDYTFLCTQKHSLESLLLEKEKAVSLQTVLGSCISQSCPRATSVTRFVTLYAPYCVYTAVTETEPLCRSKLSTRLIEVSSTIIV